MTHDRGGLSRLELRWLDEPIGGPKGKPAIRARPSGLTRIVYLFSYGRGELVRYYDALLRREWHAWSSYERLRRRRRVWRRQQRREWALREFAAGRLGRHDAVRFARCRDYAEFLALLGEEEVQRLVERALQILDRVPAVPPDSGDEI